MSTVSRASLDTRKFLLALLVDLVDDKNYRKCFRAAHRELHRFFYDLTKDEATRPFVDDLLFDTNGNYPWSDQIDELLQEFQLSGVLSRPNPTYRYNDIAITTSAPANDFRNGLSDAQQRSYGRVLDAFKKELGVPDTK